jgi:hypothetical protein
LEREIAMSRTLKVLLALVLLASFASPAGATLIQYIANLDATGETPPTSPAKGYATVDYDNVAHTLALHITFSGLLGTTTASHIHGPTAAPLTGNASVATTTPSFTGFPLGVTSADWSNVLDLTLASSYNPSFVSANGGTTAGAEAALTGAIAAGRAYWNVHSSFATGGEIRGFLVPAPEPCTLTLLGLGALTLIRRRR